MEPGDSFVLAYPEVTTMKHYARQLGVKLVWLRLREKVSNHMAQERIWRVSDDYGKDDEQVPEGPQAPHHD